MRKSPAPVCAPSLPGMCAIFGKDGVHTDPLPSRSGPDVPKAPETLFTDSFPDFALHFPELMHTFAAEGNQIKNVQL